MTDRPDVLEHSEAPPRRWQSFLPAVLTVVVLVAVTLVANAPILDLLRYSAYLVIGLLLPGLLVHRALRGRPDDVIADLSLGGAVGVVVGLIGWAIFVSLGIGKLLFIWPLLIIAVFAVVPSLRRHWTTAHYAERIGWSGWFMAAALVFYTVALAALHWHGQALPPKANFYYIDNYFHIANAAELTKDVPPDTPSVAGRPLHYHWFVNAHVAASHLMSGVNIPVVYLRLFEVPLVAIIIGLLFTFARDVIKRNWAAGVATLMLVAPNQLIPWSWFRPWGPYPLTEGSPSQTFGVLIVLLGSVVLLPLLRGDKLRPGSWAILGTVAICGPGSKPAVAPVLLFGLGCAFLVALYRRRNRVPLLAAMAVLLAGVVVLLSLSGQASAGSSLKVLGFVYFFPIWTGYVDEVVSPGTGGWILPGLGEPGAARWALLLVLGVLLQFSYILGAVGLVRRKLRWDPVIAYLFGGWFIGLALAFVVDHPGLSEIYFARTGTPFGLVLACWGLALAVDAARERLGNRTTGILAAGAAVVGVVFGYVVVRSGYGGKPARNDWPAGVAKPMIVLLIGALLLAAIWWVLRATVGRRLLTGAGVMVFCVTLLAMMSAQGPWNTARAAAQVIDGKPARALPAYKVTEKEMLGTKWLMDHTPPKAVLATNLHCYKQRTTPNCESRSYWLPAFSERRYLVETWAYTVETLLQMGKHKGGFASYPFDDPEKLRINDLAFTDPTPEGLKTLKEKYGVTWLVGIAQAGPISPKLDQLANLRFSNSDIRVYELK